MSFLNNVKLQPIKFLTNFEQKRFAKKLFINSTFWVFSFALHLAFQMAFLSELTNLRSDSEPHFRNLHQWYFEIAQKNKIKKCFERTLVLIDLI